MSNNDSNRRPPALNRDRARPRNQPAPADSEIEARLEELIRPSVQRVVRQYQNLGLRERVFTLPITLAMVLGLIWRQFPSVGELLRALAREPLLWAPPLRATESAFNQRLRCLPSQLFGEVFADLLPTLLARAQARSHPQPLAIKRALGQFARIWVLDATTLEAVARRVGLLKDLPSTPLGGKLLGVLDLPSKLPVHLWLEGEAEVNEKAFLERVQAVLPTETLLLIDRGFYAFPFFDYLSERGLGFITRARSNLAFSVQTVLYESAQVRDRVIAVGQYRSNPARYPLRLVAVQVGGTWHTYLTNVLDPSVLPTADVVDLYGRRWSIESAFLLVKRLLGLAYLWRESYNAIALQVWGSWLLYAVLLDLCGAIAQELDLPLDRISVEMVYRGLYHFSVAHQKGQASDPVAYLAAPEQADLDIVKRYRPKRLQARLAKLPKELNL